MKYRPATIALLCAVGVAVPSLTVFAQESKKSISAEEREERQEAKKPKSKRWQVSWGVDPDTFKMRGPVRTSLAHLVNFRRPAVLPKTGAPKEYYRTHRVSPVETTLWTIRGNIVSVAAEHDGDYRLIVADAKGNRVCCVMPDPDLVQKRGRYTKAMYDVRAVVLKALHPTFDPRTVKIPVEVTGVGYFGKINNDANPSPEGFQLHPLTKVRILAH